MIDPIDVVGICELCSTGIMAGEEIKDSEFDDVFYHHRCMENTARTVYREHVEARGVDAVYEMKSISAHIATLPKDSQDSILKSYEIDWGND